MGRQHFDVGQLFHELAETDLAAEFFAQGEGGLGEGKRIEALLQESCRGAELRSLAAGERSENLQQTRGHAVFSFLACARFLAFARRLGESRGWSIRDCGG